MTRIKVMKVYFDNRGGVRFVTRVVQRGPNPRVEFIEGSVEGKTRRKTLTLMGFRRTLRRNTTPKAFARHGTDRTPDHGCFGYGRGGGDGGPY